MATRHGSWSPRATALPAWWSAIALFGYLVTFTSCFPTAPSPTTIRVIVDRGNTGVGAGGAKSVESVVVSPCRPQEKAKECKQECELVRNDTLAKCTDDRCRNKAIDDSRDDCVPNCDALVCHDISIAHLSIVDTERGLPVVNATIRNVSSISQIVGKINVIVLRQVPYASIPETRALDPIATWDINLSKEGPFVAPVPVLIAQGDAATIRIRFFITYDGKVLDPRESYGYRLQLVFFSATGGETRSPAFGL